MTKITVKISKFLQVTGIINRTLKSSQIQKNTVVKICNTLALPTLIYKCEIWAIRETDKSRITSADVKIMRITAKYTWQDYKTNEDILSELKINPVVKKI